MIDGYEVNIGIELLSSIAGNLSDNEELQPLFHILAQSKCASIRSEIAYKDNISNETATVLLNDKDSSVLERIVQNEVAKKIINEAIIDQIIKIANEETLKKIASNIESYEEIRPEIVADKLISIGNPSVTLALAENYSTPKKVLKALLKNVDPDIVNAAKKSLE